MKQKGKTMLLSHLLVAALAFSSVAANAENLHLKAQCTRDQAPFSEARQIELSLDGQSSYFGTGFHMDLQMNLSLSQLDRDGYALALSFFVSSHAKDYLKFEQVPTKVKHFYGEKRP